VWGKGQGFYNNSSKPLVEVRGLVVSKYIQICVTLFMNDPEDLVNRKKLKLTTSTRCPQFFLIAGFPPSTLEFFNHLLSIASGVKLSPGLQFINP
jgi:hypothetical protein